MRTCPFCRQPFSTGDINSQFLIINVRGQESIICGDCKDSYFDWVRSREAIGRNRLENFRRG